MRDVERHPGMDPELAAGLEALPPNERPRALIAFDDIPATRARLDRQLFPAGLRILPPYDRVVTEDRTIPGPRDAPAIRVRIYRPTAALTALPGLYWIHGGGMITGRI